MEFNLDRRQLLAGGAAAGAAAVGSWVATSCAPPVGPVIPLPEPPDFPAGIELRRQTYRNWCGAIAVDGVWTCSPKNATDVVDVTNWAASHGYRLRARGAMHGWSPLTLVPGGDQSRIVLIDTTRHLNAIAVDSGPATGVVTAGAGALLDDIYPAMLRHGLEFPSIPATGGITLGGALAIDAHGAVAGPRGVAGAAHGLPSAPLGSLSNRVLEIEAVVFDAVTGRYEVRTFDRSTPGVRSLLTHLGRSMVTSARIQADPATRVRCQSFTNITTAELFHPDPTTGRSFQRFLDTSGAVEALWFPFTDFPWVKVWTRTAERPAPSREVTGPYNYPFSDSISLDTARFVDRLVTGRAWATPDFGRFQLEATRLGLAADGAADIWGWSSDVFRYIRETTIRVDEGGGALLCRRDDVQSVVARFARWFEDELRAEAARGRYPVNGPVEIRCSGLDAEGGSPGSGPPLLSALRSRPDRPNWDTAVWIDALTLPGTDGSFAFFRRMEGFIVGTLAAEFGTFRPEWSKSWAFTESASWDDTDFLRQSIPTSFSEGYPPDADWDAALRELNHLDPARVFSNQFLDGFLP